MLVLGSFSPRLWCFCVLWSWVNALTILVHCPFPHKSLITVSLSTGVLTEVLRWETRQRFAIVFPYESFANQFLSICRPDRSRIISPFDWQPFSFSHDACNLIMDGVCVWECGEALVCVCVWVCMFLCRYKKENPIFEQHIPVCLRWALSFKVYILGGLSCDILSSVNQFLCQGAVNLIQSKYVFFCGLSDGRRRTEPISPPLF